MAFMPLFVLWTIQNYAFNGLDMINYCVDIPYMLNSLGASLTTSISDSYNQLINNFQKVINGSWLSMVNTFSNISINDLFSFFNAFGQFFVAVGYFFSAIGQFMYYAVVGVLSFFLDLMLFSYNILKFLLFPTFKKMPSFYR